MPVLSPTASIISLASPDGWAVWGVVVSTRWWLLVDHCVLRNWDRILGRAVKGLISRAGMVSICPLLWWRDVKLQQPIYYLALMLDIYRKISVCPVKSYQRYAYELQKTVLEVNSIHLQFYWIFKSEHFPCSSDLFVHSGVFYGSV